MEQITIDIDADGEVNIDADGFRSSACEQATGFLEQALGTTVKRRRKAAYYQQQQTSRTQQGLQR
jgi:hypothetical protein